MSTTSIAIAKASLIAPFIRPDPTSVSRDEVNDLHKLLEDAIRRCSKQNVQRCREWLCRNATTGARISAFCKYLGALSLSFESPISDNGRHISERRQRLHILYLVNDWLHHVKRHQPDVTKAQAELEAIQPHTYPLFELAASYDKGTYPKLHFTLSRLLKEWQKQQYFDPKHLSVLATAVAKAGESPLPEDAHADEKPKRNDDSQPFTLPSHHGDPATPWYDLPAGNFLPYMTKKSSQPIPTKALTALQLRAGPANESLIASVKDFLQEADMIYQDDEMIKNSIPPDFDAMGQAVPKAELGDRATHSDNYYGWSWEFCEQLKGEASRRGAGHSRSRSHSSDRVRRYSSGSEQSDGSRSQSPHRHPGEYQDEPGRGRFRGHRRSQSRSRSRSRSGSRSPFESSKQPHGWSRPLERRTEAHNDYRVTTRRRSRSPYDRSRSVSRNRDAQERWQVNSTRRPLTERRQSSPSRETMVNHHNQQTPNMGYPPIPQGMPFATFPPPPPPGMPPGMPPGFVPPTNMTNSFAPTPAGFPTNLLPPHPPPPPPPPPPPNWQGFWPPQPPQPLPSMMPPGPNLAGTSIFPAGVGQSIPLQKPQLLYPGDESPPPDPRRRPG